MTGSLKRMGALFAGCAITLFAPVAAADIIDIGGDTSNSTEGLGDFSGTIEYNFDSGDMGSLIVSLTNTSNPANGGYITGFVFNINSTDDDAMAELLSGTHPFVGVADENGAPFGTFDAGAALGGNWEGGGSPNSGIAVGDTGIFNFKITAADAMTLAAMNFITGPNEFNFVVRFRGFVNGGSDKVPVPAPAALALLGLAGLASRRRRA
jgi:MYXO-CTERM domain-containing protein